MQNKKFKYMLFLYKESEYWSNDYESSEYEKVFSDDPKEIAETLWYKGMVWRDSNFKASWDATLIIDGVGADVESMRPLCEERQRKADKIRAEYEARMEAQRLEEAFERGLRAEEHEKREYARLKAKFGG